MSEAGNLLKWLWWAMPWPFHELLERLTGWVLVAQVENRLPEMKIKRLFWERSDEYRGRIADE